jgi:hypothetical protein
MWFARPWIAKNQVFFSGARLGNCKAFRDNALGTPKKTPPESGDSGGEEELRLSVEEVH